MQLKKRLKARSYLGVKNSDIGDVPTRIRIGLIVGVKGLRGQVRINSYTEDPEDIAAYGSVSTDDGRELTLTVIGSGAGVINAVVDGVEDRNAAETLKGQNIYVSRNVLPPPGADSLYQVDLIGLHVKLTDGKALGEVVAFHNYGGGDVMEVKGEAGEEILVPFTKAVVAEVDITGRRILVTPIPGLLDDGESDHPEEVD